MYFRVKLVQRKEGEMKQRSAGNSGKQHSESYRPLSILWHTLCVMETPLFDAERCFISPPFLCSYY